MKRAQMGRETAVAGLVRLIVALGAATTLESDGIICYHNRHEHKAAQKHFPQSLPTY
ncbi:MAG: hypothetical protein IPJ94_13940 [Chloroflexi bacterium]|nr:hypothetical protein [Chloroflexota bacterium]